MGFEPTRACALPVFKTGAINHSTTPPCSRLALGLCHRAAREQGEGLRARAEIPNPKDQIPKKVIRRSGKVDRALRRSMGDAPGAAEREKIARRSGRSTFAGDPPFARHSHMFM